MVTVALWPFCEFLMYYSMLWYARKTDSSWSSDSYKTKTTNIQQYVDIYSGPAYMIHFKYSGILNIAFVTMMYGAGIPIMFPIAVFAYFVFYTMERLQVAYFY